MENDIIKQVILMKLIVGLGNPGKQYQYTHHNVGFLFLDHYAKTKGCSFKKKFNGEYAEFNDNQEKVFLFKPMTYMNLSGEPLIQIMNFFQISLKDLLVIYDDMDLPFSTLRLRKKGNAGGHNGIKNILYHLASNEFCRIRIGIDRPSNENVVDYVLSNFSKKELEYLEKTFEHVAQAVDLFIHNQFDIAMNCFNGTEKKNE